MDIFFSILFGVPTALGIAYAFGFFPYERMIKSNERRK